VLLQALNLLFLLLLLRLLLVREPETSFWKYTKLGVGATGGGRDERFGHWRDRRQ
jgi:hypothetical protein